MNFFPSIFNNNVEDKDKTTNICSMIYGNRIKLDQTLYEYLIEFLLIFASAKKADYKEGKMKFHDFDSTSFDYWVEPRMGLRRFVFYDKSKKTGSIPADKDAFDRMKQIVNSKLDGFETHQKLEVLNGIQDLIHGYAVIIKKRNWCAQSVLPICPEMVFCEAMPNEKVRKSKVEWKLNPPSIDTFFQFTQRNFLARGGEVYYLHILQGMNNDSSKKETLEKLLNDLLCSQSKKMSSLTSFLQELWYEEIEMNENEKYQKLSLSFIPAESYKGIEEFAYEELVNYLSCKINQINRIDVLSKGIMFQVMRMIFNATYKYLGIAPKKWIVDMKGSSSDIIKKIAASSYKTIESDFLTALNKKADELNISESDRLKKVSDAKKDSYDVFKARGKELQCIIPAKGSYERFSLSEDLIRFLVLSLIKPTEKMTLDMFLEKMYIHFGIVIGPNQYKESLGLDKSLDKSLASCFENNLIEFQLFLKNTGFLRELSDATSIVENPYTKVEVD